MHKEIIYSLVASNILFVTLVAFFVISKIASFQDSLLYPDPYTNVEILEDIWEDGSLTLSATFNKTDCEIVSFSPVGIYLDLPTYLYYEDLDTHSNFEDLYDREQGKQHLFINIDTSKHPYESVEIRTVHECKIVLPDRVETVRVNKTFAVLERPV